MPDEYNVEKETEFSRSKLGMAIPNRLHELYDIAQTRRQYTQDWYADLWLKILLNLDRVCGDLLKTIDQDAPPAAAWNSRNLLELWMWITYCGASQDNAQRFHQDALRDMLGLTEALGKMHELRKLPYQYGIASKQGIAELAKNRFGIDSFDHAYERVSSAAKQIGLDDWYSPANMFLSKFAHPTAGLVIGIMHQTESHKELQATLTTFGVYFAGQCVIGVEEAVLAFPIEIASNR